VEPRGLDIIVCDADHAKGVAFNMLFMVWRYHTTAAAYRQGIVTALNLMRRYPAGIGICQLIELEAVPPDSEARTALVHMMHLPGIRHFTATYEGSGFKAAAVRAVLSSVHTLGRPKFAHSVHSSLPEAARWHAAQQAALGRTESAALIERMAAEVRRRQRESFPAQSSPGLTPH
jgi:hypothetical protein